MKLLSYVVCLVFFNLVASKGTYRVGLYQEQPTNVTQYVSMIEEAGEMNVDILVLPPPAISLKDVAVDLSDFSPSSYENVREELIDQYSPRHLTWPDIDENLRTLSSAAKQASIYVVAHFYVEEIDDVVATNIVMDRDGDVVATYKKSLDADSNTTLEMGGFTSNFGVIFGILFEEDLAIQDLGAIRNVKNYIVLGRTIQDTFIATDLTSAWAYVTESNFITSNKIYGGKSVSRNGESKLLVVDLSKEGSESKLPPLASPTGLATQDLSQYIIRPLDLEASTRGYEERLCHGTFCCEFYVKSSLIKSTQKTLNYALAVFDGLQSYGDHNLGVQNCAMFSYTGLYKHAVDFGFLENHTNIKFDRIVISNNKTKSIATLPVITSPNEINNNQFYFSNNERKVTIEINDVANLAVFGVFSRNYTKDFIEVRHRESSSISWDVYDYINSNNVKEFFDYLWIRLRIVLFIVSIYILEMM